MQSSDTSDESDVAVKDEDSDSHGVSTLTLAIVCIESVMHCPVNWVLCHR